jgi:hypothetical protein
MTCRDQLEYILVYHYPEGSIIGVQGFRGSQEEAIRRRAAGGLRTVAFYIISFHCNGGFLPESSSLPAVGPNIE